ncbi:hypothetical protein U9M48_040731 [Paspalum notatum var. saurae]|uniref:Uncharacterized protein n=1 Tax=Paspalum notatum var. saurae TaxID=547442 RepID=A0AAQ3XFV2_PASNO
MGTAASRPCPFASSAAILLAREVVSPRPTACGRSCGVAPAGSETAPAGNGRGREAAPTGSGRRSGGPGVSERGGGAAESTATGRGRGARGPVPPGGKEEHRGRAPPWLRPRAATARSAWTASERCGWPRRRAGRAHSRRRGRGGGGATAAGRVDGCAAAAA